jgi:hypothetical protein
MGLFSKEQPYSREEYDAAEQSFKSAKRDYEETGTGRHTREGFRSWPQSHYDALLTYEAEAKKRLDKLYDQGNKEALHLQEVHDKLTAKAQKALEEAERALWELREFEKEKLGMSSAAEESPEPVEG